MQLIANIAAKFCRQNFKLNFYYRRNLSRLSFHVSRMLIKVQNVQGSDTTEDD